METRERDYDGAIAVTRDIHWIGFYDREARLHCNPYLLIDEKDVILFDPGSIPHFPVVMRKVIDLVNPADITYVVAHHQDPDVCGNLAVVEEVVGGECLKVLAHSNCVWFIRHYGLKCEPVAVDDAGYKLTLSSGRVLEFLFSPNLHSPGAMTTYDTKTKTLFSSDIFGGVSRDWQLFAGEHPGYMDAMKEWHENIMPSNKILRPFMERLETMQIDRILPQHGSIIEGDEVGRAIGFLKGLPCGRDLEGK